MGTAGLEKRKQEKEEVYVTYPPIPIVKALSSQFLPSIIGISLPRKLPGPSKISCVWPWSPPPCEWDAPSCEWLWFIVALEGQDSIQYGVIERVAPNGKWLMGGVMCSARLRVEAGEEQRFEK